MNIVGVFGQKVVLVKDILKTFYIFNQRSKLLVGAFPKESARLLQWVVLFQFTLNGPLFCSFAQLHITFQSSDVTFSKFGCNVLKVRI